MEADFICGRPNRPEFGEMFGGWLAESRGRTFMVDTGVGGGAAELVRGLKAKLGGRPLDYVLLTHMDHAGGLGEIFRAWPEARAVVHLKGRPHLAEPERLWAGTRQVMGELAEMYGRPEPLDPARLIPHTQADLPGLLIVETPGHAAHHLSYRLEGTWFIGEAGGCPYFLDGRLHNRPATPPRYYPAVMLTSLERLLAEPDGPAYCAHTHERLPLRAVLTSCREQLLFWDDFLRRPQAAPRPDESRAEHLTRLTDQLFQADPRLAPLQTLPPTDQWREKYFLRNSVEGFLVYYEEEAAGSGPRD